MIGLIKNWIRVVSREGNMDLSIGVLIIGSLYWSKKAHRSTWRNKRLLVGERLDVLAPIRYGRLSESSSKTYTMVFSPRCAKEGLWGQAIVLKCVQPIRCVQDLVTEAKELWTAESKSGNSTGRISASWGCVALLRNPEKNSRDSTYRVGEARLRRIRLRKA